MQVDTLLSIAPYNSSIQKALNDTEHGQKVANAAAINRPQQNAKATTKKSKKKPHKKKKRAYSAVGNAAETTGTATGQVDAPALDDSNVGNRMLLHMGWKAGTGLGLTSQGRTEPVPVIKRRKNLGLGA